MQSSLMFRGLVYLDPPSPSIERVRTKSLDRNDARNDYLAGSNLCWIFTYSTSGERPDSGRLHIFRPSFLTVCSVQVVKSTAVS